ncbi:MAG: hypothetical protein AAB795_03460 [Patescibacteria group bacterium]
MKNPLNKNETVRISPQTLKEIKKIFDDLVKAKEKSGEKLVDKVVLLRSCPHFKCGGNIIKRTTWRRNFNPANSLFNWPSARWESLTEIFCDKCKTIFKE